MTFLGFCGSGCWVLCSGGCVVHVVVVLCMWWWLAVVWYGMVWYGMVVVVYAERREKINM